MDEGSAASGGEGEEGGGEEGGWKCRPGADRNMWQRLGGYPKAIVERNPSGARERQRGRGDPSLKRGKRGGGRKESPRHRRLSLSLSLLLPAPLSAPRGGFRAGGPIGGRTFLQRSLTKRP